MARVLETDQSKFHVVEACLIYLAIFVVQRLSLGVERLLLHKRLSPALISSSTLSRKLGALSEQALAQDKVLAVTDEADVFLCPVSFRTFRNLTLRAVVHVPAMNGLEKFSSFTYLNVLNGSC